MTTVSIVVPIYDVQAYLPSCLDSLLNQSFADIEVLCIDDCSPDDSAGIVDQYAARDARVRLIRHSRNKGLGGARNTGLRNATGEFISFIDSDDYLSDRFIEVMHGILTANSAEIAVCNIWRDDDGKVTPYETKFSDRCLEVSTGKAVEVAGSFNPGATNKMFRRELLTANGITQPEGRYYEDVLFWVKAVFHSRLVCSTAERLYYYRQRHGSIMREITDKHLEDRLEFVQGIDDFVRGNLYQLSPQETFKVFGDLFVYLLRHLNYGQRLIDEANPEISEGIANGYADRVRAFADASGWAALRQAYELSRTNHDLQTSLKTHDLAFARLADRAWHLEQELRRVRRRNYLLIGVSVILLTAGGALLALFLGG